MGRSYLKPIRLASQATSSIHQQVSRGYTQTDPNGISTFVPYTSNEMGEIHSFISPARSKYKHMKWAKTHKWKDQVKAKQSIWKFTPTFGGYNTGSR